MAKQFIFGAACAALGLSGPVASAAFTFTVVKTDVGSLDQIEVFALNDGVGTGTRLAAVNLNYAGSPTSFHVGDLDDDPSTPNEVDMPNAGNASQKSFLRIGTAANTFVVGAWSKIAGTPAPPNDPRWGTRIRSFFAAYAFSNAPVLANTGNGARFARFFVPRGGFFALYGTIGGDFGSEVPFTLGKGFNRAPTVSSGSTANVSFGPAISDGAPFSVVVNATDPDEAELLSLTVGSVAGIRNVVVAPVPTTTSPAAFTITGTVDYSLNGTTVVVPVTVTDGMATASGSFSLVVTPEPSTLAMLATLVASARRRRRR